jgi:hypothetical protein
MTQPKAPLSPIDHLVKDVSSAELPRALFDTTLPQNERGALAVLGDERDPRLERPHEEFAPRLGKDLEPRLFGRLDVDALAFPP